MDGGLKKKSVTCPSSYVLGCKMGSPFAQSSFNKLRRVQCFSLCVCDNVWMQKSSIFFGGNKHVITTNTGRCDLKSLHTTRQVQ